MTDDEFRNLLQKVLEKLAPEDGPRSKALDLSMPIRELGLSSVKSMEMICALEDAVGRRFGDEELSRVRRLEDLAALLRGGELGR